MWCSTPWPAERAALALACGLGLAGSAWAQGADPVPTPAPARAALTASSAPPQLPGSRLQGEGSMRYWGWWVYHARLWAGPDLRPEGWSQQALVLELDYQMALQGRAIAERSLQEMRRTDGWPEAQAARWLAEMQRIFPDVRAGDQLSGHYQPGQGISFWHNARPLGRVPDADFARRFISIWLAPTTSEPALRQALLGLHPATSRSGIHPSPTTPKAAP